MAELRQSLQWRLSIGIGGGFEIESSGCFYWNSQPSQESLGNTIAHCSGSRKIKRGSRRGPYLTTPVTGDVRPKATTGRTSKAHSLVKLLQNNQLFCSQCSSGCASRSSALAHILACSWAAISSSLCIAGVYELARSLLSPQPTTIKAAEIINTDLADMDSP